MAVLHTMAEAVAAVGGTAHDVLANAIGSVSIDSRDIAPGALFVAIRGEHFDGHDFVAKAIAAGAVAALVDRERAAGLTGLPLIVVEDALEGLYALARFSRARSGARIVAVTGSVGKTSTKDAIAVALAASGRTHAAIKSFNNQWGVPLMVARMPEDTAFGVFEIGMNHPGEITPLAQLVRPHVAVITTVGPVHLEFFDSVSAIADAKAEIFSGIAPGGTAIIGRDHPYAGQLIARAQEAGICALSYGFDPVCDVVIENPRTGPGGGTAHLEGAGLSLALAVGAPGRHALANGAAALLAVRALGGDLDMARAALAGHGAPEGRGAISLLGAPGHSIRLVDESYNANPVSMRAALEIFSGLECGGGRRILVLGDMLELGDAAGALHAQLRDPVAGAHPDLVFLVGRHMDALAETLPPGLVAARTKRVEEIAENVLRTLAPGDSVMLKGSNGVRLGTLAARIRERFGAST